jgi:hypothetical protein
VSLGYELLGDGTANSAVSAGDQYGSWSAHLGSLSLAVGNETAIIDGCLVSGSTEFESREF